MSDVINPNKDIELSLHHAEDLDMICKIGHALSLPERVRILKSLCDSSKNVSELAKELDIPASSVARHLNTLADAQLIFINYFPGPKGHVKYCTHIVLKYILHIGSKKQLTSPTQEYSEELPIGMFSHCHIKAPCGMVGKDTGLGLLDDPSIFFMANRVKAECLWFDSGYISYNFPTAPLNHHPCSEISFSFEICSETTYYNNNWPSDITISINGIEVLTFTSPGDFGGRRGRYTPEFWPVTSTQFGILKNITVNREGVFMDMQFVSDRVKFDDLKLYDGSAVQLTIGIKDDAKHRGGLNLFGKNFGDYPQAIIMTVK